VIHFPRIRTFVEKRFHGLFSKKKLSKSGGVPSFESFPRREHVLAVISLRLGSQQLSIHIKTLLDDLKSSKDYCPRDLFSGSNFSPEKSLQKNRSIFRLENQSCDWRHTFYLSVFFLLGKECVLKTPLIKRVFFSPRV